MKSFTGTQTLKVDYEVTLEQLEDLYCTACYGGCNYWASAASWENPEDFADGFRIFDNEETKWHVVSIEEMLNAVVTFSSNIGKTVPDMLDDYDAGDADSIIQYAIFKELTYG